MGSGGRQGLGLSSRPAGALVWRPQHLFHRHAQEAGAELLCDFGVEVTGTFDTAGEVFATETPTGEAVVAVYRGPYDRLHDAYDAIDTWMAAHAKGSAGTPGRPTEIRRRTRADTVTTVLHLLS